MTEEVISNYPLLGNHFEIQQVAASLPALLGRKKAVTKNQYSLIPVDEGWLSDAPNSAPQSVAEHPDTSTEGKSAPLAWLRQLWLHSEHEQLNEFFCLACLYTL